MAILSFYEMARAPAEGGFPFFRMKAFNAMNPARPDLTAMFLTGHILDRGLTNSNPGGHSLCHLCLRGGPSGPHPPAQRQLS